MLEKYRALFQYKDRLSSYGDFHYKDKTVVRPSYLYYGNAYTGKSASLYIFSSNIFQTPVVLY